MGIVDIFDGFTKNPRARFRALMFVGVCLPVRAAIAGFTWFVSRSNRELQETGQTKHSFLASNAMRFTVASIAAAISVGFVVTEARHKTHGAFGGERYWDGFAHATFYGLFASLLFTEAFHPVAPLVLVADIVYSIMKVTDHYNTLFKADSTPKPVEDQSNTMP